MALLIYTDFTDDQPLPCLDDFATGNDIAVGHGSAQEIDVQAGGNGQCRFSAGTEDCNIGSAIRNHHHGRARYRIPGAQMLKANALAHRCAVVCQVNNLAGVLGKFPGQESARLYYVHDIRSF